MKKLFAILAVINTIYSFGQVIYESPYVVDGKSYKFQIPEPFQSTDNASEAGLHLQQFDRFPERFNPENLNDRGDWSQFMTASFISEEQIVDFIETIATSVGVKDNLDIDTYITSKDFDFITCKGEINDEEVKQIYIAGIAFEGITVLYMALDRRDGVDIDLDEFHSLLDSYEVYKTNRKNQFQFQ